MTRAAYNQSTTVVSVDGVGTAFHAVVCLTRELPVLSDILMSPAHCIRRFKRLFGIGIQWTLCTACFPCLLGEDLYMHSWMMHTVHARLSAPTFPAFRRALAEHANIHLHLGNAAAEGGAAATQAPASVGRHPFLAGRAAAHGHTMSYLARWAAFLLMMCLCNICNKWLTRKHRYHRCFPR